MCLRTYGCPRKHFLRSGGMTVYNRCLASKDCSLKGPHPRPPSNGTKCVQSADNRRPRFPGPQPFSGNIEEWHLIKMLVASKKSYENECFKYVFCIVILLILTLIPFEIGIHKFHICIISSLLICLRLFTRSLWFPTITKLNEDLFCGAVYVSHEPHLLASLVEISMVDTRRIRPHSSCFFWTTH